MVNPKGKKLAKCLKFFFIFLLLVNILVFAIIPFMVRSFVENNYAVSVQESLFIFYMLLFYFSGICSLIIINTLRKMFDSLANSDPFIKDNVSRFRILSIMSILIALFYVVKVLLLPSVFTGIIIFVFVIAGVFCIVLKDLFQQAIDYKEENDFTI